MQLEVHGGTNARSTVKPNEGCIFGVQGGHARQGEPILRSTSVHFGTHLGSTFDPTLGPTFGPKIDPQKWGSKCVPKWGPKRWAPTVGSHAFGPRFGPKIDPHFWGSNLGPISGPQNGPILNPRLLQFGAPGLRRLVLHHSFFAPCPPNHNTPELRWLSQQGIAMVKQQDPRGPHSRHHNGQKAQV